MEDGVEEAKIANRDTSPLAPQTGPDRYRSAVLCFGLCCDNLYMWCDAPSCLSCSSSCQCFCVTLECCLSNELHSIGLGKLRDEFSLFNCMCMEMARFKYACGICAAGLAPPTGCMKSSVQCCCCVNQCLFPCTDEQPITLALAGVVLYPILLGVKTQLVDIYGYFEKKVVPTYSGGLTTDYRRPKTRDKIETIIAARLASEGQTK